MGMLDVLIGPITTLLDKFIPDAGEKARLAQEIATLAEKHAHEIALAQIEVNKTEAATPSLFKGGWRPFVGWVCGFAFAYYFILQPLLVFVIAVSGYSLPDLPEFDMDSLLAVLGGMLGLGGLRTFEKYRGVAK